MSWLMTEYSNFQSQFILCFIYKYNSVVTHAFPSMQMPVSVACRQDVQTQLT